MITISVLDKGELFQQQVQGVLGEEDIRIAASRFDPREEDRPVLWDLTEAEFNPSDEYYEQSLSEIFRDNQSRVTEQGRAFLVCDQDQYHRVSDVLKVLDPPWSWAVFVDRDLALAWLRRGSST